MDASQCAEGTPDVNVVPHEAPRELGSRTRRPCTPFPPSSIGTETLVVNEVEPPDPPDAILGESAATPT